MQNGKQKKCEKSVRKLKDECQKVRVRLKTTGETSNEPDTTFQQKQKHSHFKQLSDDLSTVQTEEKSRRVQESNTKNTKNTRERDIGGKGGTAKCDKCMPCAFVFNLKKESKHRNGA